MAGRSSILGFDLAPVPFIEDVEAYIAGHPNQDVALRVLQDNYSKYKQVESHMLSQRANLQKKIPDLKSTQQAVHFLRAKMDAGEEVRTHYELNSQMFTSAIVRDVKHVSLWLGANVMVEYTFEEADTLLGTNIQNATESLRKLDEEIQFVKDQIITSEVNVARVINHGVAQRKKAAAASAAASAGSK